MCLKQKKNHIHPHDSNALYLRLFSSTNTNICIHQVHHGLCPWVELAEALNHWFCLRYRVATYIFEYFRKGLCKESSFRCEGSVKD